MRLNSDEPVVQGYCDGVAIRRFRFTWMLDEAPDLVDDLTMQAGTTSPRVKVHPEMSAEIGSNCIGACATRMPRSPENDYLPLEAIHLIDGDPQTCWCSRSQTQPDVEPTWSRLVLRGILVRDYPTLPRFS